MGDVGRYRRLYANEWHDRAFRQMNAEARVVRLYVSAGPQTTSVGCFRLSTAVAVEDLGGTSEAFEEHLATVCEAMNWAWDPLARVVWMRDWFNLNRPANPNVVQAWAKLLRNVPDCDVKVEAIRSINHSLKELPASFREAWKELSKSFPVGDGLGNTRTETIQGSGDQGDQRSGNQRAGALRAAGSERKSTPADPRLLAIAQQTVKLTNPNQHIDELLDAFRGVASHEGLTTFTRADATTAINAVLGRIQ